ncbi:tetratricopeptide repeat protein, partial [Pyxidicoccus sp. 3LFB2]
HGGAARLGPRRPRAATGNVAKARAELAEALKREPDHAPALLIQACLALETGNDAEAEAALVHLEDVAAGSKELKLLQRLRELRRTPGTSWQQAFREAWVSLGRPDFQKSPLLPGARPCRRTPPSLARSRRRGRGRARTR